MEKQNNEAHTTSTNVILIGLSGPSSSGKTTVTKNLVNLLNCEILHQDDFYVPDDQIPIDPVTKEQNWDHPDAINFEKLIHYLTNVKSGKEFPEKVDTLEPDVNLKLSEEEIETVKLKLQNELSRFRIVLVDGFMLYHDEILADLFDLKLFYYSTYECLKARRSKRKGYSTVAGFWVDPPNYFDDYVWPAYEGYHKHLFENGSVDKNLNKYATETLNIHGFKNDDTNSISDMISWTIEQITSYIAGL